MKNYSIGDTKIKFYQKALIIISIITLFVFFSAWIFGYTNIRIPIYSLFMFIPLNLFYIKICEIKFDKDFFYIENIYRKIKIPANEFVRIDEIKIFSITYKIKFKSSSYLFFITSSDSYKKLSLKNRK